MMNLILITSPLSATDPDQILHIQCTKCTYINLISGFFARSQLAHMTTLNKISHQNVSHTSSKFFPVYCLWGCGDFNDDSLPLSDVKKKMEAFKAGCSVLQPDEVASTTDESLIASNYDALLGIKCMVCLQRPAIYRRQIKAVMDLVGWPDVMYEKVHEETEEPLEIGSLICFGNKTPFTVPVSVFQMMWREAEEKRAR